jgi:hypothetical protein
MFTRGKIYTVYEKLEVSEPSARMVMVREGFSFWALIFNLLWLLAHRLWLAALGYVAISAVITLGGQWLGLPDISIGVLQLLLQCVLAFNAYDLMRMKLTRQGYHFAGVIAAESEMHAQRRYFEFAA